MNRRGRVLLGLIGAACMQGAWSAAPVLDIENSPQFLKACSAPAGVALSNSSLAQGDVFAYVGGFDAAGLNGSLRKFVISRKEGGMPHVVPVSQWDAADILTGVGGNAPRPSAQERNIFIGKPSGQAWETVKFRWDALSDVQKAMLTGVPAPKEVSGLQRLEYLRGVRSLETGLAGAGLRKRSSLLGAIVNSVPLYVGEPSLSVQGIGYQDFHERYKNRRKAIYVGSNDGMIHAFSAEAGTELFAYIPNVLLSDLPLLTRTDYRHRPYADGRLAAAEAQVAGNWRTILAAGMGGGAQGVLALDITDPDDFSGGRGAIWEFTDRDDPDMGNVIGAPLIARFRVSNTKDIPRYKYFVVVANGVNSYRADGDKRFSSEATSVLFLLSLDKPASEKWQAGVNYFKFKTPVTDPVLPGGLTSPAAVMGDGGIVQLVYAGDLQGNLWRFDFTDGIPKQSGGSSMVPLFVAMDDSGKRQPISVQPKIVLAPGGGYVVLFGTGRYLERSDAAAAGFSKQSFYGVHDTVQKGHRIAARGELAQRVMNRTASDAFQISGGPFSYGVAAPLKKGWYVDFPESELTGERSVTDLTLVSGKIFFNSLLPGGTCTDGGGRSYALDVLTGFSADPVATGGRSLGGALPPLLLDMGLEAGMRNASGKTNAKRKYIVVNFGNGREGHPGGLSEQNISDGVQKITLPVGRLAWREVINWPELRAAAIRK